MHRKSFSLLFVLITLGSGLRVQGEIIKTFLPQVGDGGGWTTQINIAATRDAGGVIFFFDTRGNPLSLEVSVIGPDSETDLTTESVQLCAEHVWQLGGESPLHNRMEVKC